MSDIFETLKNKVKKSDKDENEKVSIRSGDSAQWASFSP
jgi:hypothetical protein